MRPRHLRAAERQRHAVLQLITKAVCTAGLIEPGPRPDAAGKGLIQQPAVQHDVHGAVGRRDLDRGQQVGPMLFYRRKRGICISLTHSQDQLACGSVAIGLTQQKGQFHGFAGLHRQAALQCGAGIKRRADGA